MSQSWETFREAIYAELSRRLKGADQEELRRVANATANMLRERQTDPAGVERVNLNPDKTVDEVVGRGALHIEQMDDNAYWLRVADRTFWLRSKSRIRMQEET